MLAANNNAPTKLGHWPVLWRFTLTSAKYQSSKIKDVYVKLTRQAGRILTVSACDLLALGVSLHWDESVSSKIKLHQSLCSKAAFCPANKVKIVYY